MEKIKEYILDCILFIIYILYGLLITCIFCKYRAILLLSHFFGLVGYLIIRLLYFPPKKEVKMLYVSEDGFIYEDLKSK